MSRKAVLGILLTTWALPAQDPMPSVIGWRVGVATHDSGKLTLFEGIDRAFQMGVKAIEGNNGQRISSNISQPLDWNLSDAGIAAVRQKMRSKGVTMPTYFSRSIPTDAAGAGRLFRFAKALGVETIVAEPPLEALTEIDKYATEFAINVAIHNPAKAAISALSERSKRMGACPDAAMSSLLAVKDRLMALHLGAATAGIPELLKEVHKLGLKPTVLSIEYSSPDFAQSAAFLMSKGIAPIVGEVMDEISRKTPTRMQVKPEERQKIESAVPRVAAVKPRKPRKLLVVDLNAAYGGHRSIPHANVAVELMGKQTGAFEPVFSNDLANLRFAKLRQFDALYLNNTVGPILNAPEIRESLLRYVREGGGLVGNHGTSRTSLDWPEFGEMLGGHYGPHGEMSEKATVKVDDRSSPINAVFGGKSFEFVDEFFRFETPPYSREKLHVLLSIDVAKTDMNQGRGCTNTNSPACNRPDKDYAISWIRNYGKGRVFYCSLGNAPPVFWSPEILQHFLAGMQFALGDLDADTTPSARLTSRTVSEMEPMLARMAAYEYGQSRVPLAQLDMFVEEALWSATGSREVEARLLKFLQSDATPAGKDAALRLLSLTATETSVPVLAGMLTRAETVEMARFALARIPGEAANSALRQALDTSPDKVKVGIINSLGERRDPKSVRALARLTSSPQPELAEASAVALANIADRPALEALASARRSSSGPFRQRVSEAYLQCAGRLGAGEDKTAASNVYRQLIAQQEPELIRIAALTGLAATMGMNAVPTLSAELEAKSARTQAAAIRLLNDIPGPEVTTVLMRQFPKLPHDGQVRVLNALALRGDVAARSLLTQAARSDAPEVRAAALAGLGTLGDESSVPLLAQAAAVAQGEEQTAARSSLYGLRGPKIDSAIVAGIRSTGGKAKVELIMAAGERGSTAAADDLMRAVSDPDPDVHRSSLRALRGVSGAPQIPELLGLVLNARSASDRREASQALTAVLKRSQMAHIKPVLSAYRSAPQPEARASLLEAMGQTSNPEALPLLRDSLKENRAEVARAAILALSEWSDAAPLADLLAAAKDNSDPTLQVLALRGYLKLMGAPSPRPHSESAGMLAGAMRLAKQPAEKKTILSLLVSIPCAEALEIAEQSLADETVATESKVAVKRIRSALNK